MKVLYTTDLSHSGNDCYIYSSVSIIEEFEMFAVIVMEKTTGYYNDKRIYAFNEPFETLEEAIAVYKEYGGVVKE